MFLEGAVFLQYTTFIKKNVDFKRMYYREKFRIGFFSVVYLKKIRFNGTFLGITVSKKVGNAVERNRVRRIIKAAYRELEKVENLKGLCLVIVAKKSCLNAKSYDVLKEIKKNIFFLRNNKFLHRNRV